MVLKKEVLDNFLNHKGILVKRQGDLAIFNYSHECQYERMWDEYTLQARGLIVNLVTREIIARPFGKFFNLNETPESSISNLPKGPFTATKKLDGILGISYWGGDSYKIATRGSFESPWAVWATKWIQNNLDIQYLKGNWTYLFEIICPESRIVVDYKGKEALVLIGIVDIYTGIELPYHTIVQEAKLLKIEVVESVKFDSIEDMVLRSKTLPADEEGWVITYSNGLKIKIKGDEYKRLHRLIAYASPLAFWRAWEYEHMFKDKSIPFNQVGIKKEWLYLFAEEYRDEIDKLAKIIEDLHWNMFNEAKRICDEISAQVPGNDDGREFTSRLYSKKDIPKKIRRIVTFLKNEKWGKVWMLIHKAVRPTENKIEGYTHEIPLGMFKNTSFLKDSE